MNTVEHESPILDMNALDAIRQLDEDAGDALVQEVIAAYLESAPDLTRQLCDGLRAGDLDKVRVAAHTLKSSSGNVGAARLMAQCRDLEVRARAGDLSDAGASAEKIDQCYRETCDALARAVGPRPNE